MESKEPRNPLPDRNAPPTAAPALPHAPTELAVALRNPLRLLDVSLSDRPRLLATIEDPQRALRLAVVLLFGGVLFALPFGLVRGASSFWHIACLFEGSLLLCFPSLHVFAVYFGLRLGVGQTLALVAWVTCTASAFTFGFSPIQWFMERTMQSGDLVTAHHVAAVLLTASLIAGLALVVRAAADRSLVRQPRIAWPLFGGWLLLFVFITYRMARLLGLL